MRKDRRFAEPSPAIGDNHFQKKPRIVSRKNFPHVPRQKSKDNTPGLAKHSQNISYKNCPPEKPYSHLTDRKNSLKSKDSIAKIISHTKRLIYPTAKDEIMAPIRKARPSANKPYTGNQSAQFCTQNPPELFQPKPSVIFLG